MLIIAENGKIRIIASDGEVSFTANCEADVKEADSVILPGRMLSEFSRYFGRSVSVESDGTSAVITSGKSRFSLSASPGAKFPKWLEFPDVLGKLDAEDFAEAVKVVNVAATRNDPVLRAVRMEISDGKLLMLSTDRSRMALASPQITAVTLKADIAGDPTVLIDASILERFSHVLGSEVSFGWNATLAGVSTEGLTVTAPQVAGEYVKGWEMITRDYLPDVPVDADALLDAVKAATLAAGDRGTVRLVFAEDLTVEASGDAGYHSSLEWLGTGEPRTLDFTPKYLIDGITACKDELTLSWTGRALLMSSGDVRYLVQPRRAVSTGE
jgi:DNA polymerase-3 subunit beta